MAQIFDIGHESDLSEYTSTVTDGGDLSQGTPGLASTSGRMEALIDDTTAIYGEKEFTQLTSTVYRWRFYIDPNGLTMGNNDEVDVCKLYDTADSRAQVVLIYDTGTPAYNIYASVKNDSGTWHDTSEYEISDAEHYVEVLVTYATGAAANDGKLELWIDGTQKEEVTGIDLYDYSKPDEARLGATSVDAGVSGTLYLDEFVLRDDASTIGAVGAGATPIAAIAYHYHHH